jgi:hypothetical protein
MSLQFLDSEKATNIKARVVESINNLKSNKIWSNKLFLATVVVPTALSILYFGPIASDV